MAASWKRGDMPFATLVRLVQLCLLWGSVSATNKCAKIEFPDTVLEGDIMPVPKSANLSIYFVFDNSDCPDNLKNSDITITIKKASSASDTKDVCKLKYSSNSNCVSFALACNCPVGGDKRSSLIKTWLQDDETTWLWKATTTDLDYQNNFQEKAIRIQQRYPPEVTSLSLHDPGDLTGRPQTFRRGSAVEVVCAVSDGNPSVQPLQPVLMKREDQLPLHEQSGKWRRRIDNVQCEDSGPLSCTVPGASHNQSAQLLVACPPMIINQVKDKKWTFVVMSYTKTFTSCNVTSHEGTNVDCLGDLVADDLPPYLVLSFSLSGVNQEADNWTLTLANEEGPGSFNNTSGQSPMELPVPEGPSKSSQDDSSTGSALVHASVIVPFFVIVAILSDLLSL